MARPISSNRQQHPRHDRRRGVTSVLAMLYLVLFGALAVGFYAATNVQVQVSTNEQRRTRALAAAESGLAYLRYHLAFVDLPPLTTDAQTIDQLHAKLSARMNGTANMSGKTVGLNATHTQIDIPAGAADYVPLGDGSRFHAAISMSGSQVVVRITGSYVTATSSTDNKAGVEVKFGTVQKPTQFYSHGMVAQGSIVLNPSNYIVQGNPASQASIFSYSTAATPVTIGNNTSTSPVGIAGNITLLQGTNLGLIGPVSVDGETNPAKIRSAPHLNYLKPTDPVPDVPQIDVSMFTPYATNAYVVGKATYDNTYIPPNTNPTFATGTTIRGVLLVKEPNIVTFNGQVNMQCVIVTEDKGVGTLTTNSVRFSGNGLAKQPLSTLPNEPQFAGLQDLTGSFILAPGFDVQLSGNFATINGDIFGDQITITGNGVSSITGTVATLKPNPLRVTGSSQVTFGVDPNSKHTGSKNFKRYTANAETYREIIP
jgi:hypothetical protein